MTSGTYYTLYIDFYYFDTSDHDMKLHSLSFQKGDGSQGSYSSVGAPSVTWAYSYDEISWTPYSGTGDIDVPWSGKVIIRVIFPVTGSLGDKFYYRVHFTYGCRCNYCGNHYFWYEICDVPGVPEVPLEPELLSALGLLALFVVMRKKSRKE